VKNEKKDLEVKVAKEEKKT